MSRRHALHAACRLALAAWLVLAGPLPVSAQGAAGDAAAKAKFVVTFARFVQWPASAFAGSDARLRLCIEHASPAVGEAFAAHEGLAVGGRSLTISALAAPASEASGCHLLFVDASAVRHAPPAAGESLLTLGAVDGFVARGGMVEIVNVDDSLRFDVNLRALRAAHLGLNSQVLRLARQVRE